jgi:hypothetical protein
MVWFNLRVGTYNLKYTTLNPIKKENEYCDSEGNLLTYNSGKFESGYFTDAKGQRHEQAFFLVNGKPMAKISKTKETDNYREVDKKEIDDLIIEKQYIVDSDKLYNDLKDSGKALKFGMALGGGGKFGSIKVYYAYVYTSDLYEGILFMALGTTKKSEIINEVLGDIKQKQKLKQMETTIRGIDKAKVEDLIQL